MRIHQTVISVVLLTIIGGIALGQGSTSMSYQGRLLNSGQPANGMFDVDFSLWDDPAAGAQIGPTISFDSLAIIDGLFTVELDFGASAFDNSDRWLEISVDGISLVPRQPMTRTPYAIQTRGIVVDENGFVGVGTDDPDYPLHVVDEIFDNDGAFFASSEDRFGGRFESDSADGSGVEGINTSSFGFTPGVYGESSSPNGYGVFGNAISPNGETYGGRFVTDSTDGYGVYGLATPNSGTNYGVYGRSNSTFGTGVRGEATAVSGSAAGGRFVSDASQGYGVVGIASDTSGQNHGGWFRCDSTSGVGVYGYASASSGNTFGGSFRSNSTNGKGVFGFASANSGETYGVQGAVESSSGRGVYGIALATSGTSYGGQFENISSNGYGVHGNATASSGTTYGGYFESNSTSGFAGYFDGKGNDAVYIENTSDGRGLRAFAPLDTAVWAITNSGFAGVHGRNASASGRALYGEATDTSGTNFGVYGRSNSASGYDFYAGGAGVNYGASSSRRWKKNVVIIDKPLNILDQLRGVYFDWDEQHGGAHDIGMIAEEVGAVLPEVVQYESNGIDASGMDYSKITPLLVEAVKELRKEKDRELDELKAEKDAEIVTLKTEHAAKIVQLKAERHAEVSALQERLDTLEAAVARLLESSRNE